MRVTTGQEAEVGHVVGLVEHGDLDGVETDELLLHEVFEATGAGDDDVDSGLESLNLAVLRDTTEDRGHAQVVCGGQRFEGCGDLGGELTRRCEHQAERSTRTTLSSGQFAGEAGDHGDGEREGLAASGLSAAQYVAPRESVGEGVDLDRERRSDSAVFESFHQRCAHTEGCEGGSGRRDVRQVCSEPFGHVFVPGCRHGN